MISTLSRASRPVYARRMIDKSVPRTIRVSSTSPCTADQKLRSDAARAQKYKKPAAPHFSRVKISCHNRAAINIDIARGRTRGRHAKCNYVLPVATCNFKLTASLFTAAAIIGPEYFHAATSSSSSAGACLRQKTVS